MLQRKLDERRKAIEKGHLKEKQREKQLDDVKSEPLVSSINELDLRVSKITSLSIPKTLQEAELKKLVQRQVQLRTMIFQQKGIKINTTEKGKQDQYLNC